MKLSKRFLKLISTFHGLNLDLIPSMEYNMKNQYLKLELLKRKKQKQFRNASIAEATQREKTMCGRVKTTTRPHSEGCHEFEIGLHQTLLAKTRKFFLFKGQQIFQEYTLRIQKLVQVLFHENNKWPKKIRQGHILTEDS